MALCSWPEETEGRPAHVGRHPIARTAAGRFEPRRTPLRIHRTHVRSVSRDTDSRSGVECGHRLSGSSHPAGYRRPAKAGVLTMWTVSTDAGAKVVYRGRGSLEINEIAWNLFLSQKIDPWRSTGWIPGSMVPYGPDPLADDDDEMTLYCNTLLALSRAGDLRAIGKTPDIATGTFGGCIPPDPPVLPGNGPGALPPRQGPAPEPRRPPARRPRRSQPPADRPPAEEPEG